MHLCVGEVPGPFLFGAAIDHSCLLWEKKCDGNTGACLYYDTPYMGWLLFAVCAVCKAFTAAFALIAWILHVRQERKHETAETRVDLDKTADGDKEPQYQEYPASNPAFDDDNVRL